MFSNQPISGAIAHPHSAIANLLAGRNHQTSQEVSHLMREQIQENQRQGQ